MTELQLPRLIDANALLEEVKALNKKNPDFSGAPWNTIDDAIFLINSAPTVETTDDVIARLSEKEGLTSLKKMGDEWVARYYPTAEEMDFLTSPTNGFGNTPLEAVKKLEASLNQK